MVDLIFLEEPKKLYFEIDEVLKYDEPLFSFEIENIKLNKYNTDCEVLIEDIYGKEEKIRRKNGRDRGRLF